MNEATSTLPRYEAILRAVTEAARTASRSASMVPLSRTYIEGRAEPWDEAERQLIRRALCETCGLTEDELQHRTPPMTAPRRQTRVADCRSYPALAVYLETPLRGESNWLLGPVDYFANALH